MSPKPALVIYSHPTTVCGGDRALRDHAERLRSSGHFATVTIAFAKGSPGFMDVVGDLVNAGSSRIIALPYFLASGRFVTRDLPHEVEEARKAYPQISFAAAGAIGYDDVIVDAVLQLASTATPPQRWRRDVIDLERDCELREGCPARKSLDCPRLAAPGNANRPIGDSTSSHAPSQSALILIAHGSAFADPIAQVHRIASELRRRSVYKFVTAAFLSKQHPSIEEALEECVREQVSAIVAVPYFLHGAKHVGVDVPEALLAAKQRSEQIQVLMSIYIGRSEAITQLMQQRAAEASQKTL